MAKPEFKFSTSLKLNQTHVVGSAVRWRMYIIACYYSIAIYCDVSGFPGRLRCD